MRVVVIVLNTLLVLAPYLPATVFVGYLVREGTFTSFYGGEEARGVAASAAGMAAAFTLACLLTALFRSNEGEMPERRGSFLRAAGWGAAASALLLGTGGLLLLGQELIRAEQTDFAAGGERVQSPWFIVAAAVEALSLVAAMLGIRALWRWSKTPAKVSVAGLRLGCLGALLLPPAALALIYSATQAESQGQMALLVSIAFAAIGASIAAFRGAFRRFFPPS